MKQCPYCAEEIKDEAIFCLHCAHDLALLKIKDEKIAELRNKVLYINSNITSQPSKDKESIEFTNNITTQSVINNFTVAIPARLRKANIAVFTCGLVQAFSTLLMQFFISSNIPSFIKLMPSYLVWISISAVGTILETIFQVGSVFTPFVFGFWISFSLRPGKSMWFYTILGLLAGLVNMTLTIAGDLFFGVIVGFQTDLNQYPWLTIDILKGRGLFYLVWSLIGPTSMFLSGALFGDMTRSPKQLRLTGTIFSRLFKHKTKWNSILVKFVDIFVRVLKVIAPILVETIAQRLVGLLIS